MLRGAPAGPSTPPTPALPPTAGPPAAAGPAPGPAQVEASTLSTHAQADMLELSPSALLRFAAWLARHQPKLPSLSDASSTSRAPAPPAAGSTPGETSSR